MPLRVSIQLQRGTHGEEDVFAKGKKKIYKVKAASEGATRTEK
jgi:hypothetical protein